MVSNHAKWRLHAELDDVTWFREIETCKIKGPDGYMYEPIWFNPVDAEKLDIKQGDIIESFNERGAVMGDAYITERIIPGAVYQDHGARVDSLDLGNLDRGGANNLICPGYIISKNCAGEVTSSFLVGIRKVNLEEIAEKYPDEYNRAYDPDEGLLIDAWIENEE